MLFAGLDVSTQGTKMVVLDADARSVCYSDAINYDRDLPQFPTVDGVLSNTTPGVSESDPRMWIEAVEMLFHRLADSAVDQRQIRALSVSGQQHGLVALDASGRLARATSKLWNDYSTIEECELLHARLGGAEAMLTAVGNTQRPGYTAPKILHMARHEPEAFRRTATFFLVHNYVNWFLTGGEIVMEPGDTSGMALWHPGTKRWAEEVIAAIDDDLPAKLPPVLPSDAFIGMVDPKLARKFGFHERLRIDAGSGDNMYGAVGTGNVRPGVVSISLGTSGTAYCFAEEPFHDPEGEISAFCDSTGHHLPLLCVSNLANGYNSVLRRFGLTHDSFDEAFNDSRPANEGRLVIPWFGGERTPDLPNAAPLFFGFDVEDLQGDSTRGLQALCRGIVEGHVLNLHEGFRKLPVEPVQIRLTGGLARSPSWCQTIADVFGVEAVPVKGEGAALGAAIHAAWVWGREEHGANSESLQSLTDSVVVLDEARRRSPREECRGEYRSLKAMFSSLSKRVRGLSSEADPFELRRALGKHSAF